MLTKELLVRALLAAVAVLSESEANGEATSTNADAAPAADAKSASKGRSRKAQPTATEETKPAGRTRGGRGTAKKDSQVNDTPEQAELRAGIIADALLIADTDHQADIADLLARYGCTKISEVASDKLDEFEAEFSATYN